MPKRKKPAETPEEQFERFKEAARTLGVDDTGKSLDDTFKRLSNQKETSGGPKDEPHRK
jgi:hypothetical protein